MWCDIKDCCNNMGCGQCDIERLVKFDFEGRCDSICIVEPVEELEEFER